MPAPRPLAAILLALTLACGGPEGAGSADGQPGAGAPAGGTAGGDVVAAEDAPVPFTEAELDAYARGRAKETELVLAARERQRTATTPEERGAAIQAEWEDATMPEAAQAAGMDEASYRRLRKTVDRVLETLDFQGKIDGPLEVNMEAAGTELKARLQSDPYAELTPASAAALKAKLPRLVELWNEYKGLTALNG
jgi:hypothetical protein